MYSGISLEIRFSAHPSKTKGKVRGLKMMALKRKFFDIDDEEKKKRIRVKKVGLNKDEMLQPPPPVRLPIWFWICVVSMAASNAFIAILEVLRLCLQGK